jgi:hypothetical protein
MAYSAVRSRPPDWIEPSAVRELPAPSLMLVIEDVPEQLNAQMIFVPAVRFAVEKVTDCEVTFEAPELAAACWRTAQATGSPPG